MHKSIHYHLHCLRLIRRSIPLPIAITIASSYIIPLFNYCNSLLFNLHKYKLIKLHPLQNALVRCVYLLPRRCSDSITTLLKQLHWLTVPHRIKYKLSLTIHKAIHHNTLTTLHPSYFYTNLSSTPDPFPQHLYPYHSPSTQTPLFIYIYMKSGVCTIIVYDHLPPLPLTTGTPFPITYEQTHQLPTLNATLIFITSPLPSLPLNNSIPRTAECSRIDAVHKIKKSIICDIYN